MAKPIMDFDGDPLRLVQDTFDFAKTQQTERNTQYKRNNALYHCKPDVLDPDRANVFMPKIYNIVETKLPRYIRAAHSTRPYIPFVARREEYRHVARHQSNLLDHYLEKANFLGKRILGLKINILHGTSFMESIPFFQSTLERHAIANPMTGQPEIQTIEVPRLRLRLKVFAPWEVYVDPYATGLEDGFDCRFIIKQELVSRRQIIKLAGMGAYPGLDVEMLRANDADSPNTGDHWGLSMVSDLGLPEPQSDDDVGIMLRYESAERYVDVWNGRTVLRDIPNPYHHGRINLSRMIHGIDPHTQDSFWGIGDAKVNEVLQEMLNDSWNMTFDSHQMMNQPVIYYNPDAVQPDALVRIAGNRIPVSPLNEGGIQDMVYESSGTGLPHDHYDIPAVVERAMDYTSGVNDMIRGESARRDSTASEAAMRKESGELRLELAIRQDEAFLADFGLKCQSQIEQFGTFDDYVEVLGVEAAMEMFTVNPNDLPGGFNFGFKGAARIANQIYRQQNMQQVLPFLQNSPNLLQGRFDQWLLETYDLDEQKAMEMIIPDEVLFQMQQAQQQQQMAHEEKMAELQHEWKMQEAKAKGSVPAAKPKGQQKGSGGTSGSEERQARTYIGR